LLIEPSERGAVQSQNKKENNENREQKINERKLFEKTDSWG